MNLLLRPKYVRNFARDDRRPPPIDVDRIRRQLDDELIAVFVAATTRKT